MGKTVVRYATAEDLDKFYGPDDPVYFSARAVVVEREGEILGVGGICRVNKQMQVFSDIRGDISKKDILRASRMVIAMANRYTSVVAYADLSKPTALGFAKHFGFQETGSSHEGSPQLYRMRDDG